MANNGAQQRDAAGLLGEVYRRGWIDDRTYKRVQDGRRNLAAAIQTFSASPAGAAVVLSNPALAWSPALREIALRNLPRGTSKPPAPVRTTTPPTSSYARAQQVIRQLDNSPTAKALGGTVAMNLAAISGVARGAWHTAQDFSDMADFALRLGNPLDPVINPEKPALGELLLGAHALADRAIRVRDNPGLIADGITNGLDRANKNLNPWATPQGETFFDEIKRSANIGLNQGELGLDVALMAYGGAELPGLKLLMRGGKPLVAADYLAAGTPARLAEYFAQPYSLKNMGHHTIARRTKLPALLGGGPVPKAILEHPMFLLKPAGMTNGEFFLRHFQVDPKYWGGRSGAEHGLQNWSGKKLGWEKLSGPELWWKGTTPMLKGTIGGVGGLGVGIADQMSSEEQSR